MLGYSTIGANDFEKTKSFYDTILADLGGKRIFGSDRIQFYGSGHGGMLAVCVPYDKNDPQPGNGNMIALSAPSNDVVDKVYKNALAHGATDDGAPGARLPTFYGAYFRDPDGNKVCVYKMG